LEVTRSNLPSGQPYARWTELSPVELEDLTIRCYAALVDDEERLDDFLRDEHALSKAFSLVRHLPAGEANLEEVAFHQALRKQLRKLKPGARASGFTGAPAGEAAAGRSGGATIWRRDASKI